MTGPNLPQPDLFLASAFAPNYDKAPDPIYKAGRAATMVRAISCTFWLLLVVVALHFLEGILQSVIRVLKLFAVACAIVTGLGFPRSSARLLRAATYGNRSQAITRRLLRELLQLAFLERPPHKRTGDGKSELCEKTQEGERNKHDDGADGLGDSNLGNVTYHGDASVAVKSQ